MRYFSQLSSEEPSASKILLKSFLWAILCGLPGLLIGLALLYILTSIAIPRMPDDIIISQNLYNDYLKISSLLKIPYHYILCLTGGVIILLILIMSISLKSRLKHPPKYIIAIGILLCMGFGFLLIPFSFGLFGNTIQLFLGLGEVSLKGWMYIGLSLMAVLSIPGVIFGMILFGIANLKRESYLSYLILPALLTILFIGGCLSFYPLTNKYHYGEYFWKRLKIPILSEGKERYVFLFMEKDRPSKIERIDKGFKVTPFEKRVFSLTPCFQIESPDEGKLIIDASLESVLNAHNYLKENDYKVWSFFGELLTYVVNGYNKSWSLKEMSQVQFETFKKLNYLVGGMVLAHNLSRFAEFDQEYLDLIDGLADEDFFHHGKIGSKRLADAYLHFGDYKKAKYWYDKANRLGYENEEQPIPKIDFTKPFFKEGKVQGKILINKKGYKGIKVGLAKPPEEGREISFDSYYISPIVASTVTDKEGRFFFDDILEGKYYLVVMSDVHLESDEGIGKFSISSKTPAVNFGVIELHSL